MNETTLPEFEEIETALDEIEALTGTAEMHGILNGFICLGFQALDSIDLDNLFSSIENSQPSPHRDLLINIYEISQQQLAERDFSFQLLLPNDDTALTLRIIALGEWCHGFISGLGLAGLEKNKISNSEVSEMLEDIEEIAKVDYDQTEADENDETAFYELLEYVRLGVIMIYTELVEKREMNAKLH